MKLFNAKSLVGETKAQETREALGQSVAKTPDSGETQIDTLSVERVQIAMGEQME